MDPNITENDLKGKKDYFHKTNKLINEIHTNKAQRRQQFIANRLIKLTNQELKKFEDIDQ